MAEWHGFSRSNYFRIKDRQAFDAWLTEVGDITILHEEDGRVAVCGEFYGGWPAGRGENYEDLDLVGELAEHLVDGEVAVLFEVGAEKLRYITGLATAVDSTGNECTVNLNDIYAMAKATFGHEPRKAQY